MLLIPKPLLLICKVVSQHPHVLCGLHACISSNPHRLVTVPHRQQALLLLALLRWAAQ
jgi:hypothetical protein